MAVTLAALALSGCGQGATSEDTKPSATPSATGPVINPSAPTPTRFARQPCPRLGVHSGWSPDHDVESKQQFGAWPQVANSYYQPGARVNLAQERERIRRGTSPNITISTVGSDVIEALGTGPDHTGWTAAKQWLDRYVGDLAELVAVDPDVPVYATIEHEFRPKTRDGMFVGDAAEPAVYGRALSLFYATAHEVEPELRTTYWIVGYDREFESAVAAEFDALPQVVVFDPYAGTADETVESIVAEDVRWLTREDWYDGQEIGLGEFGMRVANGDDAVAAFFTDVRRQLDAAGVSWAVLFNSEANFDTAISARTDGQRFPRARAAFSRALAETTDC